MTERPGLVFQYLVTTMLTSSSLHLARNTVCHSSNGPDVRIHALPDLAKFKSLWQIL